MLGDMAQKKCLKSGHLEFQQYTRKPKKITYKLNIKKRLLFVLIFQAQGEVIFVPLYVAYVVPFPFQTSKFMEESISVDISE